MTVYRHFGASHFDPAGWDRDSICVTNPAVVREVAS